MTKLRHRDEELFYEAVMTLRTQEDCRHFFEDICTIKEIQDMAQRLDTAILLRQGLSYQKIAEQVNISSATISRVNRCIQYGSGGYGLAIQRLEEAENEN